MTPASLEGQTLGKYRVLEPLGRGGMAQVYKAYHPQLNRYVAIKVLRSDLVENEEFLARFTREAQAVAGLRHPNIVQVFDFDVQNDLYFMVMELLEGDTLKAYLADYRRRGEHMPWAEMVRILLDVLDGLQYAHQEGITHRDIKPANIMLTRRGEAVVTDFGIAHIVGGTQYTISGALLGTLNYMSPEQGLKGHGDSRSDIYSLGIVFYEMLLGHTPFDADTPLAILMKHLNDPLPLPHNLDPDIPEAFERVLLRALAKQADERYQSAAEMAQGLVEAAQEAGIDLPENVYLPRPEKIPAQPQEPVAVYSGTARENIVDQDFATDDTDARLGEKLAAQAAAAAPAQPTVRDAAKNLWQSLGTVMALAMDEAAQNVAEASKKIPTRQGSQPMGVVGEPAVIESEPPESGNPSPPEQPPSLAEESKLPARDPSTVVANVVRAIASDDTIHLQVLEAALIGAEALVGLNVLLVAVLAPIGRMSFFGLAWPVELFLVGLLLSLLMVALRMIWLVIPAGIVLGNGALLAYCTLTGWWSHWAFLWVFEIAFVAGSIAYAITRSRDTENEEHLAQQTGSRLVRLSVIAVVVMLLSSSLVYVGQGVLHAIFG
jgi:serine/threonine protein kinase